MEDRYENLDLGPQNDGEPAVVETAEPVVEEAPAVEQQAEEEVVHEEPKKKTGLQRMREKLQKQDEQIRQLLEMANQRKEPEKAEAPTSKPDISTFETYEEYLEALTDWKADQKSSEKIRELETKRERERLEAQKAEQAKTIQQRFQEARTKYADFDDVMDDDLQASAAVLTACEDSPAVADLAYYFSKNPDELNRLNHMSPIAVAREIGKLEVKLTEPNKPTKPVTKAPEPIKPVGGKVPVAKHFDTDRYEIY